MPPSLAERRQSERKFLEQLLDISKLESYTVPVPIKADLRKYQQVGRRRGEGRGGEREEGRGGERRGEERRERGGEERGERGVEGR